METFLVGGSANYSMDRKIEVIEGALLKPKKVEAGGELGHSLNYSCMEGQVGQTSAVNERCCH